MTLTEFVNNLLLHHPYTPEHMTVEDAAIDLENFAADGVELPEGITPESYAAEWNSNL